jgi:hypothetical protein
MGRTAIVSRPIAPRQTARSDVHAHFAERDSIRNLPYQFT